MPVAHSGQSDRLLNLTMPHASLLQPIAHPPKRAPYGLQGHADTWQPHAPNTAPVQEVFSSVQGEGPLVGVRQLFVRFAHCPLHCAYCDTPMTTPDDTCRVETEAGSGQWTLCPNPLTAEQLVAVCLEKTAAVPHHSISFTGGEPLLWANCLAQVFPALHQAGQSLYLETSGIQPKALAPVLPFLRWVAMDVKLPSATRQPPRFADHAAFYALARQALPQPDAVFVKLVVNADTTPDELAVLPTVVPHPTTLLILQPEMSLSEPAMPRLTASHLLRLQSALLQHYQQVRVIAQQHKLLGAE